MKIDLVGTQNTRDYNNSINKYGFKMKNNLLFRSDKLDKLTQSDIQKIKNLGIKQIIDFRSKKEKNDEPNIFISGIDYIELPIELDSTFMNQMLIFINNKDYEGVRLLMCEFYGTLVIEHQNTYKKFLNILLSNQVPTLFHCTAGKDRTGIASSFILYILDYDIDFIIQDYLFSNKYIDINKVKNKIISEKIDEKLKNLLFKVDKSYILAFLDIIKENYDNLENYISNILEISSQEKKKLQQYYLF